MENITVTICTGTTCFVMSSSQLETLGEHLPADVAARVDIRASHCLGYCKDRNYGKAPFVEIDGDVIDQATLPKLIERIRQRLDER